MLGHSVLVTQQKDYEKTGKINRNTVLAKAVNLGTEPTSQLCKSEIGLICT
jgi:hypothetical protein